MSDDLIKKLQDEAKKTQKDWDMLREKYDDSVRETMRLRKALEVCNRVLHFDLRKMIEWGDGYNQAVKDAADAVSKALQSETRPVKKREFVWPKKGARKGGRTMSDIVESMKEAVDIAKGEIPAARIYHQGHAYVPLVEYTRLTAEVEKMTHLYEVTRTDALRNGEDAARLTIENARLRAALEEIRKLPGEINPSNYNDDDVIALNDSFIETFHIAGFALQPELPNDVNMLSEKNRETDWGVPVGKEEI